MLAVALAEPAVVHHKKLYAHVRSLVGQLHLLLFVNVKGKHAPGIVHHRRNLASLGLRQQMIPLIGMKAPACAAKSLFAIDKGNGRGGERLAGTQLPAEIIIIHAQGNARLLVAILLSGDLPVAAPMQRTGPHAARGLRSLSVFIQGEPRHTVRAGNAMAGFQHRLALGQRVTFQLIFRRPLACHVR